MSNKTKRGDFYYWQGLIQQFCEKRDWDQFHGPKDLAIGLATEASELLELTRFKSETELEKDLRLRVSRGHMGDELADCLFFIFRFAQRFGFDLNECLRKKMKRNARRYPAKRFRGSNRKA